MANIKFSNEERIEMLEERIQKMKDLKNAYGRADDLIEEIYAVNESDEKEMELVATFNKAVEELENYYKNKAEELANEIATSYNAIEGENGIRHYEPLDK